MSYHPVAPTSDSRAALGATPIALKNVQLERSAKASVKGAGFFMAPSMGFTSRVTPTSGAYCRGVFARPGVQDGALFAVFGTTLYRITSAYGAASVGTIPGTDTVLMDGLRDDLLILGGGYLHVWDGSTLTTVTDTDISADLATLAVLGQRAISSPAGFDQLEWSAVLDATDWPSDGFATSEIQPDPVIANVVVGDELYSLGKSTVQIWRAVGGGDADAFDTFAGAYINKGCIARDTAQRVDAALMWVADDRCVFRTAGPDASRVVNRDVEEALAGMTEAEVSASTAWVYTDGSKVFYVLRPPVGGRAFAYDVAEDVWAERTTYDAEAYRHGFYAFAYDKHFVAGPDSDTLYTMERGVYADAGQPIEREMTIHIPAPNGARIDSIELDIKTVGQPLTGQGSDPQIMVSYSKDGGSIDSVVWGAERQVSLGANGRYDLRPWMTRFGQCGPDGFLLKLRITDPVGFAFHGVRVNEPRPVRTVRT